MSCRNSEPDGNVPVPASWNTRLAVCTPAGTTAVVRDTRNLHPRGLLSARVERGESTQFMVTVRQTLQ